MGANVLLLKESIKFFVPISGPIVWCSCLWDIICVGPNKGYHCVMAILVCIYAAGFGSVSVCYRLQLHICSSGTM